jgi:hypothetical protein
LILIRNMAKLYIEEFVGISNRLETLPMAFAIRKAYGHKIILDWHELDSFSVDDTQRGKVGILARLGALRIRNCDRTFFDTLADKKILLRSLNGPSELLDPIYLETASKIHLAAHLATSIKQCFAPYLDRPVVGVHIRQGDFRLASEDRYEIAGEEWPAIPLWWYQKLMASIVKRQPDTCFFLSCTGDPSTYLPLHQNFDVFTLDIASPYNAHKGADHFSSINPVADIFALACTPIMLATPISGYSHWAANVLGEPTTCIVPIPGATPDNPKSGRVELFGQRLPTWRQAGREGTNTTLLSSDLAEVDFNRRVQLDWL